MKKKKKLDSINRDFLVNLIDEEYKDLEKHLKNVLKNDNVTFNAYQKTLLDAKESVFKIITGDISSKKELGELCDKVKRIYDRDVTAGFKKGRRKGRAISNNLSIVKKKIRGIQAKLSEDFLLSDIENGAPKKQETITISPRDKFISALKGSEMDEDIGTFFAERMKAFLVYGLDNFYERVKKQVFDKKVSEENLIFVQRIFQYLYTHIEEKIISIDADDLDFRKIQNTLKQSSIFQTYFNENKGRFCGDSKEKQKILDIFNKEIVSGVSLIDSCNGLNDFLEQTLDENKIPTSLEEFQDIFVQEVPDSLSTIEKTIIQEGYEEGLDILKIVKI